MNRSYFGILLNVSEIRRLQNLQYDVFCVIFDSNIHYGSKTYAACTRIEFRPVLHNLALMITEWSIKDADPKGKPIELSGLGTVVAGVNNQMTLGS